MKLLAVGLDFRSGDLDLRVKMLNLKKENLRLLYSEASELLFLGTCNRVELYCCGNLTAEEVLGRWARVCGIESELLPRFFVYEDLEVLKHLFRVTSSLESMVVGESQILGQVKQSYEEAARMGTVGAGLHKIFQRALRIAKKVRTETDVGRFPVSIPSIAVRLAEKVVGVMTSRRVFIAGLGEMGRLAAEYFASIGPCEILLYNRTQAVADEMMKKLRKEGVAVRVVDQIADGMKDSDVLVSAIDGIKIDRSVLDTFIKASGPRFVLDLSVPPSVDVVRSDNIFYYTVDDLQKMAAENSQLRTQELAKANEMITTEAERIWRELRSHNLKQAVADLEKKVSELRSEELNQLKIRLKDISEEDWAQIVKTSERLTSRVLKDPLMQMRLDLESSESAEPLIHFFRNLFKI